MAASPRGSESWQREGPSSQGLGCYVTLVSLTLYFSIYKTGNDATHLPGTHIGVKWGESWDPAFPPAALQAAPRAGDRGQGKTV